jgi:hypothetical protein
MCSDPSTLHGLSWFLCFLSTGKHLSFYASFGTVLLLLAITAPVSLALGFSGDGGRGSLVELPLRAWHTLATPAEHLPGPPRRGPLRLELYDARPPAVDPPAA